MGVHALNLGAWVSFSNSSRFESLGRVAQACYCDRMHSCIPSPEERQAMMAAQPNSGLGELGLARTNARVLLRLRFPGFVFNLKARTSSNGDVKTLTVTWPQVPGAPSREEVYAVLAPFSAFGKDIEPASDGMSLFVFQQRHGVANVLALSPRVPKPEDLAVALSRRLGPAAPSPRGPRF